MSMQSHIRNVEKATRSVLEAQKAVRPRFRQRYHFMAPACWLNDPNGLIQFRGQYHLFYQHNPYSAEWGPMHWGHAVSGDLLHWEHLPVAIAPSESYESGSGGCFSGSAVEKDGELVLIYTGASCRDGGMAQSQCLAVSRDGIHFAKHPGNPVLTRAGAGGCDFRDPKVWKRGDRWYMAIAARGAGGGEALLFESQDLTQWKEKGTLARSGGQMGEMWECPDFFELGGRGVLLFSPMRFEDRKAAYLTGTVDYAAGVFSHDVLGETDWGFDFYAAQSFADEKGRRILIGWANGWDWMPWWNGFGPAQQDGWCGSMSIPREVSLCEDGKLSFRPVEELKGLRTGAEAWGRREIRAGQTLALRAGDGISFDLSAEFDLRLTTASSFGFLLRCSPEEQTVLTFDLEKKELLFDRSRSDPFSKGVKRCGLELSGAVLSVRVLSDTCSLEIFTDEGRTVMSSNVYPSPESTGLFLFARGGSVFLDRLESWGLRPSV